MRLLRPKTDLTFLQKRSHIRAKQLVALECDKITDAQYATAN